MAVPWVVSEGHSRLEAPMRGQRVAFSTRGQRARAKKPSASVFPSLRPRASMVGVGSTPAACSPVPVVAGWWKEGGV